MGKKLILVTSMGAALLGLTSSLGASPITEWDFEAYGGFAKVHTDEFPNPGYDVLLTPLPPRDHQDMGAFHWTQRDKEPSLLGINQKKPLVHGQSWKAPGGYYGQKNPIKPGTTSIHGNTIGRIVTNDNGDDDGVRGEVIGWTTHYNNWIPAAFEGGRVAVNYHLRLLDPGSDVPIWDSGEMFFFMDVFETENMPAGDCCPDGNLNKTPPNENGCADRFRVGLLKDPGEDVSVENLENAPPPGSCFDEFVGSFTTSPDEVTYSVYFTGFWEAGDAQPVGEGWSPEMNFTHFEVRAEVWEGNKESADEKREAAKCNANLLYTGGCNQ